MTTNDPAPAVPVGVQPEPAEEACDCSFGDTYYCPIHGHAATYRAAVPVVHPVGVARCTGCPAVPVVHPEPAEEAEPLVALVECQPEPECQRADTWAGSWCVVHGGTWPCISTTAPAVPVVHPEPGDRFEVGFAAGYDYAKSFNDAEVAAAVAAVRADTEAALALHTGLHQCVGGSWYSDNDPTYHGTVARHTPCPTAAALRGLS